MFIKRKEEIHANLTQAALNMTGREILSKNDQGRIRVAVDNYFLSRQKVLEEAISMLNITSKTSLQLKERWENWFYSKASESIRILSDEIKNTRDTLFTRVIVDVISQESIFYLKLSNMQLSDVMTGDILEYIKQYETEKISLLGKWEKIVSDNKPINQAIDEMSVKLLNIYKDNLGKIRNGYITLREDSSFLLKAIQKGKDTFPSGKSPFKMINYMMDWINIFSITNEDMANRFDRLYRSEETITVVMFGSTRNSVKEFLEKTNWEKAEKNYIQAEKHAYENANNMLTQGQKEDATLFVQEATKITKLTLSKFKLDYEAFVDKYKSIFIGPVGERTVNDLINKERWDFNKKEWQNINLQSELKKIYDDNREWVNIDAFELPAEIKKQIEEVLKAEADRLKLALNQVGDSSVFKSLILIMTLVKDTTFRKVKDS